MTTKYFGLGNIRNTYVLKDSDFFSVIPGKKVPPPPHRPPPFKMTCPLKTHFSQLFLGTLENPQRTPAMRPVRRDNANQRFIRPLTNWYYLH